MSVPLFGIHRIAFKIDDWLYPSLRDVLVQRPLFIVGLPRSGTTLLHRLLASDEAAFATMPLWELVFAPAVCQKRLVQRLGNLDQFFGRPVARMLTLIQRMIGSRFDAVHLTRLTSPEEDFLGLLPFDGCFLKVLLYPFDQAVWDLGYFQSRLGTERRKMLVATYKRLIQRHLFFRGTDARYLAKNPSLTTWVPALAEAFPDATFIGLRRSPVSAVPSQLSSLREGMALFGNDVTDPRIVSKFINLLSHYWFVLEHCAARLPESRFLLIEYQDLVDSKRNVVERIETRFGSIYSIAGRRRIMTACEEQQSYRSSHLYSLAEFGIDRATLMESFGALPNEGYETSSFTAKQKVGP
ncbi:sulfotransferase family protein [Rhodopirellula sp. MGV]|uniref:sulfotransferase family protein n=1 Tax=Rhodopirellula sp. MGV TaxID=2023130 RepID=UPI0013041DB7|nr:sulfotransferase [Rhodopirellula sp. MGV]